MVVEVKINNKQVTDIQNKLKKAGKDISTRKVMNAILLKVKNNILLRTNAGLDVNMKPFKRYKTSYAKKEGKTIVNLTRTGAMLNSMTQKVLSNTEGKIFFNNVGYLNSKATTRELARYHNEGDGVPKREFFGVNAQDNQLALFTYQQAISAAIRKVGLK